MTKRKLTKQQVRNQAKIRADRLRRAELFEKKVEHKLEQGELGPEQSGLLVAHHGVHLIVEDSTGELHQCKCRKHIDALATGDRVIWRSFEDSTGVIVAVEPRHQILARPTARHDLKPMAANVDQMVIVCAPEPEPTGATLDRYLVICELLNLKPLLLINKSDLLSGDAHLGFKEHMSIYDNLGYTILSVSKRDASSITELGKHLADKTSVFVGQSGVGKSSLISALVPDANIRVGKLSDSTLLGQHTTSCARLYHLPQGGDLIDSPGIRRFGLWHLEKEKLIHGFREFASLLGTCQFRNCQHEHEPGCALLQAAEKGDIHPLRLEHYYEILDTHARMAKKK